jgi:hypothetical protein
MQEAVREQETTMVALLLRPTTQNWQNTLEKLQAILESVQESTSNNTIFYHQDF